MNGRILLNMQTKRYEVDAEGFAPFVPELELVRFESSDCASEKFYVLQDVDGDKSILPEMLKSARHVHRHFLGGLSFVLVASSAGVNAAHIARSVYKPHFSDWTEVVSNISFNLIVFNDLALGRLGLENIVSMAHDALDGVDAELFFMEVEQGVP